MYKLDNEEREFQIDDWLRVLYPMPDLEAAVCHLYFSLLVQDLLKGVRKDKQNPTYTDYLRNAGVFLKDSISQTDPSKISLDRTLATFYWARALHEIVYAVKEETSYPWLYLIAIKGICYDSDKLFEGKSLKEAFNDIAFNDRGRVYSAKAEELIKEYIPKAKIKIEKEWEDGEEELDQGPLDYYQEHWDNVRYILNDMPYDNSLVFHAISLLLCRKCLEPKSFTKYQKAVVKAVSAYTSNSNQHQKDFTISNANEAFDKLKEKVLERIGFEYEEMYDDGGDLTFEKDRFTLATDICLEEISLLNEDQVKGILNNLTLDEENFYVNSEIEEYCQKYYRQADILTEEALEDWGDENDEEDFNEEESNDEEGESSEEEASGNDAEDNPKVMRGQSKEEYKSSVISKLENLDTVHDLFFHVIYLKILVDREIPSEEYNDYRQVLKEEVELYSESRNNTAIENARKKLDDAFSAMLQNLLDKALNVPADDDTGVKLEYHYVLACLDYLFQDIPSIASPYVEKALRSNLTFDNGAGEYYNDVTDAYTLKFLSLTTTELFYYFQRVLEKETSEGKGPSTAEEE